MITAEELRRVRFDRKETQEQFGAHFGVKRTTILKWETEGPPNAGTALPLIKRVLAELRDKTPHFTTPEPAPSADVEAK